jgi:alpha-tubulin suppressor-like RCC1 family protein
MPDEGARGSVLCWGRNAQGELGDSTTTRRLTPVLALIPTPSYFLYPPVTSAGNGVSCAHLTTRLLYARDRSSDYPGYLYCWGANENGQAGAPPSPTVLPREIGRDLGFPSSGVTHSCAVHYDIFIGGYPDGIWCWGDNRFGQLGDGTTVSHSKPASIQIPLNPVSVGAGDGFSCAYESSGRAFCWGRDPDGQLGDGTTTDKTTPVRVGGSVSFGSIVGDPPHYPPIAVGAAHVCAAAADRTAYCWGRNDRGQLGDGTTGSKSLPVAVSGGLTFAALAAGGAHTCGIESSGILYCWGANDRGQLGTGVIGGTSTVPTRVATTLLFSAITAGKSHTCAIAKNDGRGYCWGLNADGQLGDGTTIDRANPTPIADVRLDAGRTSRRP